MRRDKPKPAVGAQLAVSRKLSEIFLHNPLPQDPNAEKGVLSCYLHNNDLLDYPVNQEWFHHPCWRMLYLEMKAMRASSQPVELILLTKWLVDRGLMEQIGGPGTIPELLDFVPTPQHFKYYLDILIGCHLSRAAVQGGQAVMEAGYHHDTKEMVSVVSTQMALIQKAARGVHKEPSMEDQLEKWQEDWNLMASGKKTSTMPTRWKSWNKKVFGISPGYTVLMGPRASGKSVLGQNIITDACLTFNRPGLIVSYEMPVRMIINRLISDIGNINGAYLFHPDTCKPTPEIIKEIGRCLDRIRASRLKIIHDVTMDVLGVVAKAKQIYAKHGDCVVMVDYLQITKSPKGKSFDLREQEIAGISAPLRDLSKELNIPVLALSQVNKDRTSRESNAPEQDADEVYLIDRYRLPNGDIHEGGIICVKARNGEDGKIDMSLDGACFRFTDSKTFIP